MKFILSLTAFFLFFLAAHAGGEDSLQQPKKKIDTAEVEKLIRNAGAQEHFNPMVSLSLSQEALTEALASENPLCIVHAYIRLGITYNSMTFHEKALENILKAVDLCKKHDFQKELANAFNEAGGVFYNQADYKMAGEYFSKALRIRESLGDARGVAGSLNNVGESYRVEKDFKTALIYYKRAMQINDSLKNRRWVGINLSNMGAIYLEQKDFEKALDCFTKQLTLLRNENIREDMHDAHCNLGNYWLVRDDAQKALSYFTDALSAARSVYSKQGIIDAMEGLSKTYAMLKDYPKAYEYLNAYMVKKDSVRNIERERNLLQMNLRFRSEQTEHEIQKLESDKKAFEAERSEQEGRIRKLYWLLGLLCSSFLVLSVVLLRKRRRG